VRQIANFPGFETSVLLRRISALTIFQVQMIKNPPIA
jgi:hypothetical protein